MTADRVLINGNEGDDLLIGGRSGMTETIQGGKGDDRINTANVLLDDGTFDTAANILANSRGLNAGDVVYDGGEGDDEIWAGINNVGTSKYYGGNGDDTLKSSLAANMGSQLFAGQGGRDLIDTAWLDSLGNNSTYGQDDNDLLIFGDWGYGSESDPYNPALQYGDIRLEEQLWGDDDIIRVGGGYGGTSETTNARVWAGDGDDEIDISSGWYGHEIHGGRGDDTITFDGAYTGSMGTSTLNGGLGDDLFIAGENFAANSDM